MNVLLVVVRSQITENCQFQSSVRGQKSQMVFVWYRKYRAIYWTVPGMIDWMFWENPQFMEICLEDPPEFWGNQFWQFDIATQIPNQSAFALCGWGGAASSVSHVGSTLFSDRDRLLQFQTHVSVKHDAQFDYSHPTSRVNFQKRENWAGRTTECLTQ